MGRALPLVGIEVFAGNVVLGNLGSGDLALVGIERTLDSAHRFGLERLPLFRQLFHAFRIVALAAREALDVSRLSSGLWT